jgi:hypothetical protein
MQVLELQHMFNLLNTHLQLPELYCIMLSQCAMRIVHTFALLATTSYLSIMRTAIMTQY